LSRCSFGLPPRSAPSRVLSSLRNPAIITAPVIPATERAYPVETDQNGPQFHQSHSTTHPHRMAILHPEDFFSFPPPVASATSERRCQHRAFPLNIVPTYVCVQQCVLAPHRHHSQPAAPVVSWEALSSQKKRVCLISAFTLITRVPRPHEKPPPPRNAQFAVPTTVKAFRGCGCGARAAQPRPVETCC
jgi:hypothetical protein